MVSKRGGLYLSPLMTFEKTSLILILASAWLMLVSRLSSGMLKRQSQIDRIIAINRPTGSLLGAWLLLRLPYLVIRLLSTLVFRLSGQ